MAYEIVRLLAVLIQQPSEYYNVLFAPVLLDFFVNVHPKSTEFKLFDRAVSQGENVPVTLHMEGSRVHNIVLVLLEIKNIRFGWVFDCNKQLKLFPTLL